jgi:hypothetical protein
MKRFVVGVILVVAIVCISLFARGRCKCQWRHTADASYLVVPNETTIVVLRGATMRKFFGQNWEMQELFYRTSSGMDSKGQAISVFNVEWPPLAKGQRLFMFGGTEWEHYPVAIYSLDTQKSVKIEFDFKSATMVAAVDTPPKGHPQVQADGQLRFFENVP